MAQLIGLARVGKDVELRYTANNDAVANVSLAFSYGKKGQDGNKPSQWAECSIWGKRAEVLCEYLVRGQQVFVVVDDVHIEEYEKRDGGTGTKLVGNISNIEFGASPQGNQQGGGQQRSQGAQQRPQGGGQRQQQQQPQQRQAAPRQQQQRQASQGGGGGFSDDGFDMDSDIPFVSQSFMHDAQSRLSRRMSRHGRKAML